jgi:hypothetical protein
MLRDAGMVVRIDAVSRASGAGDPVASTTQLGAGTLAGGNLGTLAFRRQFKTWGPPLPGPAADQLDVTLTNISAATIDPKRARLTCGAKVNVTTDGPAAVTLAGCNRTIQQG